VVTWLRHRWNTWWEGRHRPTEQWVLSQRNIYIVPTRAGLAFGVTLVICWWRRSTTGSTSASH
jgi:hypothetical protein